MNDSPSQDALSDPRFADIPDSPALQRASSSVTTALVPVVTADRVGLLPSLARVLLITGSMPPPETSAS